MLHGRRWQILLCRREKVYFKEFAGRGHSTYAVYGTKASIVGLHEQASEPSTIDTGLQFAGAQASVRTM